MRSKPAQKRIIPVDPIYKSRVVARFINFVMLDGKKSVAEKAVYGALAALNEDQKQATVMFEEAVKNVMPKQEVRSRRVGGSTYQVPFPVKHARGESLAFRWIVDSARAKKGKPMLESLILELKDAYEGTGASIRKRDDTHKMADSNKAFSHFRF